jgi:hypothetical protein
MPDDYNIKTAIAITAFLAVAGVFWLAAHRVDKIQRDTAASALHRGPRWLATYYEGPAYRSMLASGFWAGFGLSLIAALAVFCTNWMPSRLDGVSPP